MTTTVVKTIGTGGDYTTLQAWEDAAPANLVTVDQIWRGECKNQVFTESVSISGSTSDSTRYKELTTEAGASFSDNASVQTNALRYNTANGACVTRGTAWAAAVVSNSEGYARVSKLQIAATHSTVVAYSSAASTSSVDQCVIEYTNTVGAIAVYLYGGAKIKNSLVVCRAASASNAIIGLRNGSSAYNCTFVSTVSTASNGVYGSYSASTVQNCAVFGATTFGTGTAATCTTSYSNAGSLPSGVTSVAYDTSTGSGFENITDATRDFRIKSGSALLDVGTTDATNGATDIAGTARPQSTAYDVGAWELVVAGGTISYLGWFDGELRPDGWFDAELQAAGWWDTEIIQTIAGGGGPQTYNESLSESFAAGDALTSTAVYLNAYSAAIALGDTYTAAATYANAFAESVSLTDTAIAAATYANSLNEQVGAADGLDSTATYGNALTESVTTADALTTTATFGNTLSETIAAADGMPAVMTFTVTLAESVSLLDDYLSALIPGGGGPQTYNETLAETLAFADDYLTAMTMGNALSEAIALTDGVVPNLVMSAVLAEGITLADGSTVAAVYAPTLVESFAAGDALTSTAIYNSPLVESVLVSDGVTSTMVMAATLSEAIALAVDYVSDLIGAGGYTLTFAQAQRLYQIHLLHGLKAGSPLTVSPTQRDAGGVVQSVTEVAGVVTVATTAVPVGTGIDIGVLVDELAALHGLGVDLVVTDVTRVAGSVSQTMDNASGVTTVTKV